VRHRGASKQEKERSQSHCAPPEKLPPSCSMRISSLAIFGLLLLSCRGQPADPADFAAKLERQLERTRSSDAAVYLLFDLEAVAQRQRELRPAVTEIVGRHVRDPRHVVRGVAIRMLASLNPDNLGARDRRQRYLLDPHEPLELRDGVLAHPITTDLPSREEALTLLRLQAEQTGRRIGHE